MCLEESFCPFTRDALNFSAAENICRSAPAVITAPRDAPFNIHINIEYVIETRPIKTT